MPRARFIKEGNAIWISHLDTMRLFQRAFKRSGLLLKHTQGFNPRPSVSIAMPLSVGVESECELLDFELDGQSVPYEEIMNRLNTTLVPGVAVTDVYDNGIKLKDLKYLKCSVSLEYDNGIPEGALQEIRNLFSRSELFMEKKGKNGLVQQDIIPMIKSLEVDALDDYILQLKALICCQEPSLNPSQLINAVNVYLPQYQPNHSKCRRLELHDGQENIFR